MTTIPPQHTNSQPQFSQRCTDNYLQLNDDKTKEKVIHTAKAPPTFNRTFIRGQPVELVNSFKYLGLTIDNKLNFNKHVITTHKRAHHRLYVIRKLKSLSVAPHLLLLLYKSIIQPILMYRSPCFFTLLTVTSENRLLKIRHIASKITNLPSPSLSEPK